MARLNTCNVLSAVGDPRQLWHFSAGMKDFNLNGEKAVPAGQLLPANWVAKDWGELVARKLNIAWLPLDSVFLRVLQLPKCDPSELLSMVEFQLEHPQEHGIQRQPRDGQLARHQLAPVLGHPVRRKHLPRRHGLFPGEIEVLHPRREAPELPRLARGAQDIACVQPGHGQRLDLKSDL